MTEIRHHWNADLQADITGVSETFHVRSRDPLTAGTLPAGVEPTGGYLSSVKNKSRVLSLYLSDSRVTIDPHPQLMFFAVNFQHVKAHRDVTI